MDPKAARAEWPRIRYFRSHCSTNLLPPSLPSPYAQPLKNIHIYILKVFLTVLRNTKEIHHTCISSESVLDRISSSFPLPQILLTLQREIRIKSYKTRPWKKPSSPPSYPWSFSIHDLYTPPDSVTRLHSDANETEIRVCIAGQR